MSNRRVVLFLYTRLPDYLYQCVRHFVDHYSFRVVIVHYPGDDHTKYSFTPHEDISLHRKQDTNLTTFVAAARPVAIFLSGWSDRDYTTIGKQYVKDIPVILGLDNPWLGLARQHLLARLAPWTIRSFCNTAWVAGRAQYEYAHRLGFPDSRIFMELYAANTERFYQVQSSDPESGVRRALGYVGRLVPYKQPDVLARLFNKINEETENSWDLIIAGEGPLKEDILDQEYANVKVLDFVSPDKLPEFYMKIGIFCLPSRNEHWGVAVHEAAAAGMPLLLSDSVQAGSSFLINHFNGSVFRTGDEQSFEKALRYLMGQTSSALRAMGDNSRMLSKRITQTSWSAILNSMIGN